MSSKQTISTSHIPNRTPPAEQPFLFFDRITTSISYYCFFAHIPNIEIMRKISLAELSRDIKPLRLLGNMKFDQVSRFAAVAVCLAPHRDQALVATPVSHASDQIGSKKASSLP